MAFFSVIIPLYNKQHYIGDTLNSILKQSFSDFEIIIVNDGSTDSSLKKVKAFTDNRIRLFTTENRGVSAARNFAMQQASGTFFAFMDADDYWYPQHLEKLYQTITALDHLSVFTTLLEVEKANGIYPANYSNLPVAPLQEVDLFETSLADNILSPYTTAIHKDVFSVIGPFNETISNGEDTEYWIRIGFHYKVGLYNGITARHTYVPGSLSNRQFDMSRFCNFEQFTEQEKTNPTAKKVIDINRFSLALKCKMYNDNTNYNRLIRAIDRNNLLPKQRFLLRLPGWFLTRLLRFKNYLERKNIRLTAF